MREFARKAFIFAALIVAAFDGGAHAQLACQNFGTPLTISGSISVTDPLQTGRIARDGRTSGCPGKPNVLFNSTPVRYRAHNFTNPTGARACVTVETDFTGCGSNATGVAAYSNFVPAAPASNLLGDLGYGSLGVGDFSFSVEPGASFTVVAFEIAPNSGCASYSLRLSYSTACKQPGFDWNTDGLGDLAMLNPNTGVWRFTNGISNSPQSIQWGIPGDIPQAGDYTGDGRTDLTVFRPGGGVWWRLSINDGSVGSAQWGLQSDLPAAADYDGDGKLDLAVFRPENGAWYILRSSNQTFQILSWGTMGDRPVQGDYDGDRKADIAVFRPTSEFNPAQATWWILLSNFDYSFFTVQPWGIATDKPVQADYDGDGKTDVAIYRPSQGIWYYDSSILPDGTSLRVFYWGISTDVPQPADYDGDAKADPAVYRPGERAWYVLGSTVGFRYQLFGEPGEVPVTAPNGIRGL